MSFGIGIIGCGLIGKKRAYALGAGGKLIACADQNIQHAQALAKVFDAQAFEDWHALLALEAIDIVIIATPHYLLAEMTLAALKAGKHILVEKPAAAIPEDIETLIEATDQSHLKVRVGFNHRYHRSFRKARKLFDSGVLGSLMFIRARYGHGGRIGYEKEWRSKPEFSGGGELMDQGSHLVDLSRWFLGDFSEVDGFAHTYFWPMPVDDNGFMLLKTPQQQVAFLHASCTEWKNLFSMEIYGKNAKLEITGLGGSYGTERLAYYKMLPEMGPPETTIWEYPMNDDSWSVELAEFYDDIHLNRQPSVGLKDAYEVLKIIRAIYQKSGCNTSM